MMEDRIITEIACTKDLADKLRASSNSRIQELLEEADDHKEHEASGCEYFLWDGISDYDALEKFMDGQDPEKYLQRNEDYDERWFSGRFVDNPFFNPSISVDFSSPSGLVGSLERLAGRERTEEFLAQALESMKSREEPGPK